MPKLRLKATGALEDIPDSAVTDALATGLYEPPGADVQVPVVVDGYTGQVSGQDLGVYARDYGARPETEGEFRARERTTRIDREHGGVLGGAAAFTEQAIDQATFGGFGAVTDTIWGDDYTEDRRERVEANPVAAGLGSATGLIAPAIASGGTGAAGALARATPAGLASRLGTKIAESGGGGLARSAIGYATEGALYGSGHVLAETILQDKELSAQAFLAGAGEGAAMGGLGGIGINLLGRGAKAAKRRVDSLSANRAIISLEAEQRVALKEAEKAQRAADKARLEAQRHAQRLELEGFRQKGRIEAIGARGEVAGVGAEARVAVADRKASAEIAKADALAAIARAKVEKTTEALAVERAKYDRAKMVMDGRLQLSETYTAGWRGAGDSREAVAATKLEAAEVGADAKLRTGLADAIAKSGRPDAGHVIEELIPAKMRTKAAQESAKGEVLSRVSQTVASVDDLVRQADEILSLNPGANPELKALRDRAAQASPAANEWAAKWTGAREFQEENLDALTAAGFAPPKASAKASPVKEVIEEVAPPVAPPALAEPPVRFSDGDTDAIKAYEETVRGRYSMSEADDAVIEGFHRNRESYDINEKLRSGRPLDEEQQELVDGLESIFARPESRLPTGVVLSRGVRRGVAMPQVGDDLTDQAYMFASLHTKEGGAKYARRAEDMAGKAEAEKGFQLEIEAPAGTPALVLGGFEAPVLLPKGMPLRVLEVNPETRVVRARYMGDADSLLPSAPATSPAAAAADVPMRSTEWADRVFRESRDLRTPEEVRAASAYQASAFTDVNNDLRGLPPRKYDPLDVTSPPPTDIDPIIDMLDSQMSQIPEPALVFRGLRDFDLGELRVGDVIDDPAYLSTSLTRAGAERFAMRNSATMMEIELPAGTWAAYINENKLTEAEILLERGTPLRVLGESTKDGKRVLRVRAESHLRATDDAAADAVAASPGFDPSLENQGAKLFDEGASVQEGVPSFERIAADEGRSVAYSVKPSELAERDLNGLMPGANRGERIASIKQGWDEGADMPPIEVHMAPSGRLGVADGNHRLLAAAETDRPVLVRFRPVDEASIHDGPMADEVRAALPRAAGAVDDVAAPSEFQEGLMALRDVEEAQYDLAQAMRPYLDDVTGMSLDDAIAGMDEAVAKQDDILTDAITRHAEATAADAAMPPPPVPDAPPPMAPDAGPLPSMPPMPGAAPAPRGALASGATSALGVLDLAATLGGLPNANDIPVVGPLLGTYLKYRAVAGALGKVGIRVGGPVARIAKTGAAVQDRASSAIAALVNGADKAAPAAARATTPLTSVLGRPLWDLDEEERPARASAAAPAPKKARPEQLYEKRREEILLVAEDPDGARQELAESIPAPPQLAAAIADAVIKRIEWLAGLLPQENRAPTLQPSARRASQADIDRLAVGIAATADPVGYVLGGLRRGAVSPVAVQALREVYPRLYAQMQSEVIETVATAKKPIPYDRKLALSQAFDLPLDPTMTPDYLASRQEEWAVTAQSAPAPTSGPQLQLSSQSEHGATRRAMR